MFHWIPEDSKCVMGSPIIVWFIFSKSLETAKEKVFSLQQKAQSQKWQDLRRF